MPTININTIAPNSKVYVTGIVDYSRIASHIDGAELAADNARRVANGLMSTDKPHTKLQLSQCTIDYADPNAPTDAEQFINGKFFKSTKHPEKNNCYAAMNKSKNLPNLYCRKDAKAEEIEALTTVGELAPGTPVTVMLRFFSTPMNNGVSLDTVIVNEKPVKWGSSSNEAALAERGFKIVGHAEEAIAVRNQLNEENVEAQPAYTAAPITAPMAAIPMPVPPVPETPAAAPSLPIPPHGYTYDANNRLVPIASVDTTQQTTGGIRL